jgi:hypothetical protein
MAGFTLLEVALVGFFFDVARVVVTFSVFLRVTFFVTAFFFTAAAFFATFFTGRFATFFLTTFFFVTFFRTLRVDVFFDDLVVFFFVADGPLADRLTGRFDDAFFAVAAFFFPVVFRDVVVFFATSVQLLYGFPSAERGHIAAPFGVVPSTVPTLHIDVKVNPENPNINQLCHRPGWVA